MAARKKPVDDTRQFREPALQSKLEEHLSRQLQLRGRWQRAIGLPRTVTMHAVHAGNPIQDTTFQRATSFLVVRFEKRPQVQLRFSVPPLSAAPLA
jgi:hypothetical protein